MRERRQKRRWTHALHFVVILNDFLMMLRFREIKEDNHESIFLTSYLALRNFTVNHINDLVRFFNKKSVF